MSSNETRPLYLQEMLARLQQFWSDYGCVIMQPYHTEVGAGTFNPSTLLRALGHKPWKTAYVEPSSRPADGRYGENPFRGQHYFQYQVLIKPSPDDIRFVEDNWEGPTLGAWGTGWEVWCDGMEITQFTYFQQAGGIDLDPISVEITYGVERIAMFLQNKESMFDIDWAPGFTYGDVYQENERQFSIHNYEVVDVAMQQRHFEEYERECQRCLDARIPIAAYDYVLKCSHAFNLLDARGAISVTDRTSYIQRVRNLARATCELYIEVQTERSSEAAAKELSHV